MQMSFGLFSNQTHPATLETSDVLYNQSCLTSMTVSCYLSVSKHSALSHLQPMISMSQHFALLCSECTRLLPDSQCLDSRAVSSDRLQSLQAFKRLDSPWQTALVHAGVV